MRGLYDLGPRLGVLSRSSKRLLAMPDQISGLKVWLKANTGAFSDAGTTPVAADGTVRQWNDQSGNAFHALQATAGNRPQYKTNQVNGFPSIRFTNSGAKYMKSAVFGASIAMPYTVVMVMKINTIQGTTFFDGNSAVTHMIDTPGTTTSSLRLLQGGGSYTTSSSNVITTSWGVLTCLFKAGAGGAKIRLNGVNLPGAGTLASDPLTAYTLGARGDGGTNTDIDFTDIAIYGRELLVPESQSLERQHGVTYALSIA